MGQDQELTMNAGRTLELSRYINGAYARLSFNRSAGGYDVYVMGFHSEDESIDIPDDLVKIVAVESIGLRRLTKEWVEFCGACAAHLSRHMDRAAAS